MAYGREWDQGKAYGNTRPREDDEYYAGGGGHKRQKNNVGAFTRSMSDDLTLRQDYDEGYVEDYSYDDRRREQGPRRRLVPSEASPHIIFLGLDQDFTEADVRTSHWSCRDTHSLARPSSKHISSRSGVS